MLNANITVWRRNNRKVRRPLKDHDSERYLLHHINQLNVKILNYHVKMQGQPNHEK